MIKTFKDDETEGVFHGYQVSKFPSSILRVAMRKLLQINAAIDLRDLKIPPGNHLEALKRDRQGQWSVRVNQQWRICFTWQGNDAYDVEIVDYH